MCIKWKRRGASKLARKKILHFSRDGIDSATLVYPKRGIRIKKTGNAGALITVFLFLHACKQACAEEGSPYIQGMGLTALRSSIPKGESGSRKQETLAR